MFCFLSTFSCTGNVNVRVAIPTQETQVQKLLSVVWKRNAELLNLLHVVEQVWSNDHAGDGNIVVWQQKKEKKRINNNVDNVLVSQLLIKATYFLYRFNYLFCHIELINLRLLLSLLLEMQREKKKKKKAASITMCKLWLCVSVHSFFRCHYKDLIC